MCKDSSQLERLTHEERLSIEDYAFKVVELRNRPRKSWYDGECVTAYEGYLEAKYYRGENRDRAMYIVIETVLYEVVGLLESLTKRDDPTMGKVEKVKLGSEIKALDKYKNTLQRGLSNIKDGKDPFSVGDNEPKRETRSQVSVFSNFSDEELEYFWNGVEQDNANSREE